MNGYVGPEPLVSQTGRRDEMANESHDHASLREDSCSCGQQCGCGDGGDCHCGDDCACGADHHLAGSPEDERAIAVPRPTVGDG